MIFKDTIYFYLMFLIPILILLIIMGIRRRKRLVKILGDESVIKKVTDMVSPTKRFWKYFLIVAALFFIIVSVTRPQMGVEKIHVKRKGVDIMVLLDTSISMAAEDVKPDRLTRAKMWIGTLIENLVSDKLGIIAFAGKPFLQCPLTTDYSASRMLLDMLSVNTIPVQGTDIAEALELALRSFPEKRGHFKVIILVTDGEDHEGNVMKVVNKVADRGIKVITIGIGSEGGEPIPVRNETGDITGYKKNEDGELVMSRMDRSLLESIANGTGGNFFNARSGRFEMKRVIDILDKMEKEEFGEEWLERYEERFEYPLVLAVFLLLMELFLTDRVTGSVSKEEQ